LNLKIHRGTNEIGGNCIEISTAATRVLFDFGMPLVEPDKSEFNFNKYKSLSTKDLIKKNILPDITGLYTEDPNMIDAVIISHPHLDHYGFINYVQRDIPIYIGKAAHELIKISTIFTPSQISISSPYYYQYEKRINIGDISITPYLNDHSAFDAYSFLIEGDGKRIFYSGDFRGHGRKGKLLDTLVKTPPENIDYLLMEGTNLGGSKKNKSEDDIQMELLSLFNKSNGINLVYQAGQNIDRIVSVFKACKEAGKIFVLDVYYAYLLTQLVKVTGNKLPYPSDGFKNVKVFFSSSASKSLVNALGENELYSFQPYKITRDEIDQNFDKIVMIVRGALLPHFKKMNNIDGGNFIYSLWEGYQKKQPTKAFVHYFVKDRKFNYHYVHSSGHADLPTLTKMVNGLNPKKLIPIHTFKKEEYKQKFNKPTIELKDGELLQC
jgi:ribonuclease J